MKISIFNEPASDLFVCIRESRLAICGGNKAAAALLAVLEYKHRQILENRENSQEIFKALKRLKRELPPAFREWQFYSNAQLERLVLIAKTDAINGAADELERLNFIEREPPAELRDLFRSGLKKWFRLRADVVQAALDEWAAAAKRDIVARKVAPALNGKPPAQSKDVAEIVEDWKRVHLSPRTRVAPNDKRWKLIAARLRAGYTVERCRLAIRGICFLPHNMGENANRQIYNSLGLIFRDGEHLERYEAAALRNGLTEDNFLDYEITRENRELKLKAGARVGASGGKALTAADCDRCDRRGLIKTEKGFTKCNHK